MKNIFLNAYHLILCFILKVRLFFAYGRSNALKDEIERLKDKLEK